MEMLRMLGAALVPVLVQPTHLNLSSLGVLPIPTGMSTDPWVLTPDCTADLIFGHQVYTQKIFQV